MTTACDPRPRPNRASRHGMQLDRAEPNAGGQIDNQELPAALGQRQRNHEPVQPNRHRLDAGIARNVNRRAAKHASRRRPGSPARYPAGNDRDQSSEAHDQHHAHHDNKDLERAHAPSPR